MALQRASPALVAELLAGGARSPAGACAALWHLRALSSGSTLGWGSALHPETVPSVTGLKELVSQRDEDSDGGRSFPQLLHGPGMRASLLVGFRPGVSRPSAAFWQLQSRGISTSPFSLTSAESQRKDGATKVSVPEQLAAPKADDCDQAISTYDDLSSRLAKLRKPSSIRTWDQLVRDLLLGVANVLVATVKFIVSVPGRIQRLRSIPREEWKRKRAQLWKTVKHEAHHYWVGTKLLAFEVRVASSLAMKAARGVQLTRRERRQLTRTTADLFRLVPMIIILVIPFLEFALPLLLRIFPNMLPSTYEDKLKKEEELKRRLGVKLELARFLQDTVAEMAKDLMARDGKDKTAQQLYDFINRVRAGEAVENHELLRFAQLFSDDITLDSLERLQLVTMCQFVGITPFGTDSYLRNKLRQHLLKIKHDDHEIEAEGLENLSEDELRAACRARGMRAPFGEGAVAFMRRQMQDWLDLSLHRGMPSSLLLMSRAFTITASIKDVASKKQLAYEKLRETLGAIPSEVVENVEFEALGAGAEKGPEAMAKKLEYLKREEELIKQEAAEKAAAQQAAEAAAAAAVAAADSQAAAQAALQQLTAEAFGERGPVAAAGVQAAAQAVIAQAIKAESLSPQEKAEKAAAEREARVAAIITALISLASRSGVAQERAMFLNLVRAEIDRVNANLAESAGSRNMAFSSKGLEVVGASDTAGGADAQQQEAARAAAVSASRLNARVSKMLHNIEKELDKVEDTIGSRMHVLDVDMDGVVSRDEIENAISFLKTQLSPEEMELFYAKLNEAARHTKGATINVADLLAVVGGQAPAVSTPSVPSAPPSQASTSGQTPSGQSGASAAIPGVMHAASSTSSAPSSPPSSSPPGSKQATMSASGASSGTEGISSPGAWSGVGTSAQQQQGVHMSASPAGETAGVNEEVVKIHIK